MTEARGRGYVVTHGQLTPGAIGVAAPLRDRTGRSLDASISVVALRELDIERAGELVVQAAGAVTAA
ncbi:hypothetical protein Psuf_083130 [Phytohabitans suffuscus]|uniref:IclR-ED domain-containing protein n=1 Tax=Phytohabitans suffuscus TaxID=624315 RepID=A0A6F8YXU7_9ACTN|nr:hypothetical protein [Phytohabitans suffuscus]BCB91000.1 hypothetical protein Psuf_083130 [Phytohabitans suffuscus]